MPQRVGVQEALALQGRGGIGYLLAEEMLRTRAVLVEIERVFQELCPQLDICRQPGDSCYTDHLIPRASARRERASCSLAGVCLQHAPGAKVSGNPILGLAQVVVDENDALWHITIRSISGWALISFPA